MSDTGWIRGGSDNIAEAVVNDATTGAGYIGTVTVYVTLDGGAQTLGTVGGGLAISKGRGQYQYFPTAAESDGRKCTYLFEAPGAVTGEAQYWAITPAQSAAVEASIAADAYSVRDLLTDVLIELGVAGMADPIDNEIYQFALRRLLAMYRTFQAQRLLLFAVTRTTFALVPSQQVYTVGDGGDFDMDWPLWIAGSEVIPADDTICLPFTPYGNRQEWFDEPLKDLTDQWPQRFLYERTYPLGTLTVWPTPTTAALVALATPNALTLPSSLDTTLIFSPGYQEAWLYNLAKRLYRPMGKRATVDYATLVQDARESLSVVKRLNYVAPRPTRSELALLGVSGGGGYDIRSNQTR